MRQDGIACQLTGLRLQGNAPRALRDQIDALDARLFQRESDGARVETDFGDKSRTGTVAVRMVVRISSSVSESKAPIEVREHAKIWVKIGASHAGTTFSSAAMPFPEPTMIDFLFFSKSLQPSVQQRPKIRRKLAEQLDAAPRVERLALCAPLPHASSSWWTSPCMLEMRDFRSGKHSRCHVTSRFRSLARCTWRGERDRASRRGAS